MTVHSSPELVAALLADRLREAERARCADEAVRAMRCCHAEPSLLRRLLHLDGLDGLNTSDHAAPARHR